MIAENLRRLKDQINQKCKEVNRESSEINLIAVSKYFGIDAINEAFHLGLTNFGENKAQELRDKFEIIGNRITWHFIGSLQRNKVKYVIKSASYIHSVDSISLAQEINSQAEKFNKKQKILIEVKTSYENSKSGVEKQSEINQLAEYCKSAKNIELVGLMTMAPFTENMVEIRKSFKDLSKLKNELISSGFNLTELSMGMTNDFLIAIEEGATMLRIGSAIFGERDYSKDWRHK
jgi:PLP dependent protein